MKKIIAILLMSYSVLSFADDNICKTQKEDYMYFRDLFLKEYSTICTNGCNYTPSMNKNSDTLERIAGTYYLQNCDLTFGRLQR